MLRINQNYLFGVVEKTEKLISKKIHYLIYSEEEFNNNEIDKKKLLLIWSREL